MVPIPTPTTPFCYIGEAIGGVAARCHPADRDFTSRRSVVDLDTVIALSYY